MTRAEMVIVRRIKLPKGAAKVHVCACVSAGVCLACGKEPMTKRGLGTKCHRIWRQERQRLTQAQAEKYDDNLVMEGKLLLPQQILALREPNVFRDAAVAAAGQ
jgi:hypothetical protein